MDADGREKGVWVAELILLTALHLVLTGLPLAAAALLGARAGVRSVPLLLALGLAGASLAAFLAFWAYWGEPLLGESFSYFLLIGSVAAIGWSLRTGGIDAGLLRRLALPASLWALASTFVVFLGFVHGGTEDPIATSTVRFSHPLPGDSQIPFFYSEWFFQHGHEGRPPVFPGEWLFSDRPPLQVGFVLAQRPFAVGNVELNYQVLGVILQQLWVVGLWALLLAARVRPLTRGLAAFAVLLSDLAILNGFFVWPKMLPAALVLALAAMVLTPLWDEVRGSTPAAVLAGALAALAMLGHGSAVFGIVPLALLALWRGPPSGRWIGVGVAVAVVLMGCWSAYQKWGDPPGNRVVKWMLAGVLEVDDRGVLEAVRDSYRQAGFDGALRYKEENFRTMIGAKPTADILRATVESDHLGDAVRNLRVLQFFYLLPSLGLLLLGPVLMAVRPRARERQPQEWRLALLCLAVFAVGAVIWGLAIFGSPEATTVKHISGYALPVLGIVGCVVGLRAVFPRFGLWFAVAVSLLNLAIYAPALDPPAGSSYSVVAIAVSALALAGFALLAFGPARRDGSADSGDAASPTREPAVAA